MHLVRYFQPLFRVAHLQEHPLSALLRPAQSSADFKLTLRRLNRHPASTPCSSPRMPFSQIVSNLRAQDSCHSLRHAAHSNGEQAKERCALITEIKLRTAESESTGKIALMHRTGKQTANTDYSQAHEELYFNKTLYPTEVRFGLLYTRVPPSIAVRRRWVYLTVSVRTLLS